MAYRPGTLPEGVTEEELITQFLAYLESVRNYSPLTVTSYSVDLHCYLEWCYDNGVGIIKATHSDIRRFLSYLTDKGYARRTINRRLSAVRTFYGWLVHSGLLLANPAETVTSPKIGRSLPHVLSETDVEALLDRVDELGPGVDTLRDRTMLEFLYAIGCREAELSALNLADIDPYAMTVRLTGKGRKTRIVPVHARALQVLDDYLRNARPVLAQRGANKPHLRDEEHAILLGPHGLRMTPDDIRKRFATLMRKLGVQPGVSPHTMRHTFATDMLSGGADLRSLQEMLGHASLSTTQVYTHLAPAKLKAAVRQAHPRGL